jgi:hypothetical protein
MSVENLQGDAKVSCANENRKTSAGVSKARSRTCPLQTQRTKQGLPEESLGFQIMLWIGSSRKLKLCQAGHEISEKSSKIVPLGAPFFFFFNQNAFAILFPMKWTRHSEQRF